MFTEQRTRSGKIKDFLASTYYIHLIIQTSPLALVVVTTKRCYLVEH